MKVKDGFKFGIGFLIAYDLYKSLCYLEKKVEKKCRAYIKETKAPEQKNLHNEAFPTCKNKIGFTIE